MKKQILVAIVASASCMLAVAGCNKDESTTTKTDVPASVDVPATKPDNTAMNKTDRSTGALTPVDQGENSADIKITAELRRSVMDDKTLSTNAQNAKIITNQGTVTLRGVVNSAAEKDSLETRAKAIAGVTTVDNQLEVKNP